MMRAVVLLAAAVALLPAASGNAQEFARTGFYLWGGGSFAHDTFTSDLEKEINNGLAPVNREIDLTTKDSLGANGRVGYRFHPHLAAELQGEWIQRFDADGTILVPRMPDVVQVEVEPFTITANAKGYLFKGRYQPYALVGLGVMSARYTVDDSSGLGLSESDRYTDFAMRFGAGLDVWITEHIAISAGGDYVLPFGAVEDFDYVSAVWGVQFQF